MFEFYNKRYVFWAVGVFLAVTACSSARFGGRQGSEKLSLNDVDKIKINVTTSKEVLSTFGAPSLSRPSSGTSGETWLYCEESACSQGRLTLRFDTSAIVQKVIWNSKQGDSEQSLDTALGHYQGGSFAKKKVVVDYGSYLYTWEAYESQALGLVVGYDEQKNAVTSITRTDPQQPIQIAQSGSHGHPKVTVISDPETAKNP